MHTQYTEAHTSMYRITGINSFYSFLKLSPHVTGSLTWWVLLKMIFSCQILFPSKSYFDCDILNLGWWKLDFWQVNSRGMSWKYHEWCKSCKTQTYLVIQLWWHQREVPETLQPVAFLLKMPSRLTLEVREYRIQAIGNRKPLGLWNQFIDAYNLTTCNSYAWSLNGLELWFLTLSSWV